MDNVFKLQLLETTATLITGAFGLVAALAWNEAIKGAIAQFISADNTVLGLIVYAVIVTVIAVIMTLIIAKSIGKLKESMVGGCDCKGKE